MSKKDASQLVRDLRRYFAEVKAPYTLEVRGGHWHVVNQAGRSVASFGSTPSDNAFRRNTVAYLRQRGVIPRDWR